MSRGTAYCLVKLLSQFWPSPLFHVFVSCFLTCIRFLRRQVMCLVLPSSQFVVIHVLKGFSFVSETEVDIFSGIALLSPWSKECWQFNLSSSVFSKPSLHISKFSDHVLLKLILKIWGIILLTCGMSAIVWQFEHQSPLFDIRYPVRLGIQFVLYFSYSLDETLDLVFSNFSAGAMEDKSLFQNTYSKF